MKNKIMNVISWFALFVVLAVIVFDVYIIIDRGLNYYTEVEVYEYNGYETYMKVNVRVRYDKRHINKDDLNVYCIDCIVIHLNDLDELGGYYRDDIYEFGGKLYIRHSLFG